MHTGSMVAIATPMNQDGSLCWSALENLIEFHISSGTTGIVAVGTTGESATLSVSEHTEVIRFVVDKVAGRVPVIAGTGANSTSEAIELTREAAKSGADACLLVTPYYNKPGQEGLYRHYMAIADAVDIPQILYNVPGRTACDMLAETVIRLATHKNIVGIKEATGSIERLTTIKAGVPDDFALLSGDDASAYDFMAAGGHGLISVTANVCPAEMQQMCAAALAGNLDEAKSIQDKMMPLHRNLFVEANPIPVKWALAEMDLIPQGIRLPLTWLAENHQEQVRNAMKESGLL